MTQQALGLGYWHLTVVPAGLILLLIAACADLRSRTIPNWISVALAGLGLTGRLLTGPGAAAISVALAAALFLVLSVAHARGGIGGGDVKLMSAVALGLSPLGVYQMLLVTAFAGGVLAVVHLLSRRLPRPACSRPGTSRIRRLWTIEKWRWRRPGCLPYGVAIACGGGWALLAGAGT